MAKYVPKVRYPSQGKVGTLVMYTQGSQPALYTRP